MIGVEITDDGCDIAFIPAPAATEKSGSGLAGLAERAAAHGGRCEAGVRVGGAFRLFVSLPIEN